MARWARCQCRLRLQQLGIVAGSDPLAGHGERDRARFERGELVVRWGDLPGSNLCSAYHSETYVRNTLADGFELVTIDPEGARGNPTQDVIVLRTFAHSTVEGMAAHASIPVINALSDLEHPCQALADYSVLQERFGNLKNVTLAYVGDGNNVAHSLLLTGAMLGSHVRVATPPGYQPNAEIFAAAQEIAQETGATVEAMTDPREAVSGADAVYTDAWASMGQENEADARIPIFQPYQVNEKLMAKAAPHAVFMHCLPAHRGQEATDAVMDSPQSVVFDQAEGRLHVQKAILMLLLWGGASRFPVRSAHV